MAQETATVQEHLEGVFLLGVFQGVESGQYPKLIVQSGDYTEKMDFSTFDKRTGAATIPGDLAIGTRIAVRLFLTAKTYKDKTTGEEKSFCAKFALAVHVAG